jgi:DNA (cytosine-5)-methyltransferase 1
MNTKMTHGSLFSGIGGFDLAAEWMGWENKFHCEWNEFGQRVLNHYWPNAELFTDITKSDFTKYYGTIDLISGGFPCQPYSAAGKRLGKEDERHLWPEMLRVIREVAPRFVVGENVRGLTNWNGGMVFDEVCADLENLGYQVAPFIIPASAVNAPHQRERVWFVAAKTDSNGFNQCDSEHEKHTSKTRFNAFDDLEPNAINTKSIGWNALANDDGKFKKTQKEKCRKQQFSGANSTQNWWRKFPSQSPICGGDDGLPTELDGITFSKWRAESIKGYGNAICPQVVFEIFKAIESYEAIR